MSMRTGINLDKQINRLMKLSKRPRFDYRSMCDCEAEEDDCCGHNHEHHFKHGMNFLKIFSRHKKCTVYGAAGIAVAAFMLGCKMGMLRKRSKFEILKQILF